VVVASGRVVLLGSGHDGPDGGFEGQEIVVEVEVTGQQECAGASLLTGSSDELGSSAVSPFTMRIWSVDANPVKMMSVMSVRVLVGRAV
jgi:hypothetical protein